jgi:hypothetical protein
MIDSRLFRVVDILVEQAVATGEIGDPDIRDAFKYLDEVRRTYEHAEWHARMAREALGRLRIR